MARMLDATAYRVLVWRASSGISSSSRRSVTSQGSGPPWVWTSIACSGISTTGISILPAGSPKIRAALPPRIARFAASGMRAMAIALSDDWIARSGALVPRRTRSAPISADRQLDRAEVRHPARVEMEVRIAPRRGDRVDGVVVVRPDEDHGHAEVCGGRADGRRLAPRPDLDEDRATRPGCRSDHLVAGGASPPRRSATLDPEGLRPCGQVPWQDPARRCAAAAGPRQAPATSPARTPRAPPGCRAGSRRGARCGNAPGRAGPRGACARESAARAWRRRLGRAPGRSAC